MATPAPSALGDVGERIKRLTEALAITASEKQAPRYTRDLFVREAKKYGLEVPANWSKAELVDYLHGRLEKMKAGDEVVEAQLRGAAEAAATALAAAQAVQAAAAAHLQQHSWQMISHELRIQPEHPAECDVLGYGSDGLVVYAGTFGNQTVAVRRALKLFVDPDATAAAAVALAAAGGHPNAVRLFAFEEDGSFVYLASARCERSLADRLRVCGPADAPLIAAAHPTTPGCASAPVPSPAAVALGAGVARGLAWVHSLGMAHGDVRPSKVFVSRTPAGPGGITETARLGGGGLVRRTRPRVGSDGTRAGCEPAVHRDWAAPETLVAMTEAGGATLPPQALAATQAADVYSLGLLLFHLFTGGGRPPPVAGAAAAAAHALAAHPEAADLVPSLLAAFPPQRPTAAEAAAHPLFWPHAKQFRFLSSLGAAAVASRARSRATESPPSGGWEHLEDAFSSEAVLAPSPSSASPVDPPPFTAACSALELLISIYRSDPATLVDGPGMGSSPPSAGLAAGGRSQLAWLRDFIGGQGAAHASYWQSKFPRLLLAAVRFAQRRLVATAPGAGPVLAALSGVQVGPPRTGVIIATGSGGIQAAMRTRPSGPVPPTSVKAASAQSVATVFPTKGPPSLPPAATPPPPTPTAVAAPVTTVVAPPDAAVARLVSAAIAAAVVAADAPLAIRPAPALATSHRPVSAPPTRATAVIAPAAPSVRQPPSPPAPIPIPSPHVPPGWTVIGAGATGKPGVITGGVPGRASGSPGSNGASPAPARSAHSAGGGGNANRHGGWTAHGPGYRHQFFRPGDDRCVVAHGLPPETGDAAAAAFFAKFGPVACARVQAPAGVPAGAEVGWHAFVEFESPAAAAAAVAAAAAERTLLNRAGSPWILRVRLLEQLPCRFYAAGACNRGASCLYTHGPLAR